MDQSEGQGQRRFAAAVHRGVDTVDLALVAPGPGDAPGLILRVDIHDLAGNAVCRQVFKDSRRAEGPLVPAPDEAVVAQKDHF